MVDTKTSGLSAAGTLTDADVLAIVNGGVSAKVTLTALTAYFEGRGRVTNASVANQTPTGATDTYLVGSDVVIPVNPSGGNRLQAKSRYRMVMAMSKTAAGAASMVVNVRLGTAGTTADTARATITFGAQTAAIDNGQVDLNVLFRTVGSGTAAVIRAEGILDHQLATTGWTNVNSSIIGVTSSGFDSTVANLRIGCSVVMGSSTVPTITSVGAELFNLA